MYIASINMADITNNPLEDRPAASIWFTGCSHKCTNCHNPHLWDKYAGHAVSVEDIMQTISLSPYRLKTVILIGGEPLDQNIEDLSDLTNRLVEKGYKIFLYTGYEIDEVPHRILKNLEVIKTGKYDETQATNDFPASRNQQIYTRCGKEFIKREQYDINYLDGGH